ncbi:MAG: hypothetical protein IT452_20425 [Planctomycetia bacterium]|nr:hypothetical protein [Planctomycetia bacterium]
MKAWDAVLLAAAAGMFLRRPAAWWLSAAAPLLALAARPLGAFAEPAAALAALALAPRFAPAALLLAAGHYAGWADAARSAAAFLAVSALLHSMEPRFDEVSPPLRGAPIRLFAAGVLYYALLPVAYL